VDERHGECRLHGDDLGGVGNLGAEDHKHSGAEIEQGLGRVLLAEPHRPVGGLERPEAREVGLDVLDGWPRAAGDPPE
jgi:hypothetical protein